jgi:hypothetical protein
LWQVGFSGYSGSLQQYPDSHDIVEILIKKTSTIRSMVYLEHMDLTSRIRYQEKRAKMRNELKYYLAIFNI